MGKYYEILVNSMFLRQWAFWQTRKTCGVRMRWECRERFPRHQL